MVHPGAPFLQRLRNIYRRCQFNLRRPASRGNYRLEELLVKKKRLTLHFRRWSHSCQDAIKCSVRMTRSKLRRTTRSAVSALVWRRSRWHYAFRQSAYRRRRDSRYSRRAHSGPTVHQHPSIAMTTTSCPAPQTNRGTFITLSPASSQPSNGKQYTSVEPWYSPNSDLLISTATARSTNGTTNQPSTPSPLELSLAVSFPLYSDALDTPSQTLIPASLSIYPQPSCTEDGNVMTRRKPQYLALSPPSSLGAQFHCAHVPIQYDIGRGPPFNIPSSSTNSSGRGTTMWPLSPPRPESRTCVQSSIPSGMSSKSFDEKNIGGVNIGQKSSTITPPSVYSEETEYISAAHRIPGELLEEILKHYAALRPLLPIEQLCREISAISPHWWKLTLKNIDSFVLSSGLLSLPHRARRNSWLRNLSAQQSFDTVAYCSDQHSLPDEELESIFSTALMKCRRAVVITLYPSQSLMGGHYPEIDFTGRGPWSHLEELHLDCPITDRDAYNLLSQGRHTLKAVSLNLTGEVSLDNVQDSPISLELLQSLALKSQIDLFDFFLVLNFPAVQSLSMDPHTNTLPPAGFPWHNLKCFSLTAPSFGQFAVDVILSGCLQLTYFAWKGDHAHFTISQDMTHPHLPFPPSLREVYIKSDKTGCKDLAGLLQRSDDIIQSLSISFADVIFPPGLTSLKVLEATTTANLNNIFSKLQASLVHAQFIVGPDESPFGDHRHPPTHVLSKLETVDLFLLSHFSLEPLWETLNEAPNIKCVSIYSTNISVLPDLKKLQNLKLRQAIRVARTC